MVQLERWCRGPVFLKGIRKWSFGCLRMSQDQVSFYLLVGWMIIIEMVIQRLFLLVLMLRRLTLKVQGCSVLCNKCALVSKCELPDRDTISIVLVRISSSGLGYKLGVTDAGLRSMRSA